MRKFAFVFAGSLLVACAADLPDPDEDRDCDDDGQCFSEDECVNRRCELRVLRSYVVRLEHGTIDELPLSGRLCGKPGSIAIPETGTTVSLSQGDFDGLLACADGGLLKYRWTSVSRPESGDSVTVEMQRCGDGAAAGSTAGDCADPCECPP